MNLQSFALAVLVGVGAATGCALRVLDGAPPVPVLRPPTGAPPVVQRFYSCSEMYAEGWTLGVYWIGGTYRSTWNEAERATFGANGHLDHDRDWHACER